MKKKTGLLCIALLCLLTACCQVPSWLFTTEDTDKEEVPRATVVKEETRPISETPLTEDKSVYAFDDEDSVVTMYLTVSSGNARENTDHTWAEVNAYSVYDYDEMGAERYKVQGLLQVGDEDGPLPGELGYGIQVPNATVNVRGQTSSRQRQKSYKIEIKKDKGLWREQRTIALNKHVVDPVRITNKLSYDLMKENPAMIALRTQFVHLYVRDLTADTDGGFVDYGLYTQVEQPNQRFLKNHGLDENGALYKTNMIFEFYNYEDIRLTSDPLYDEAKMSYYLENKTGDTNEKLKQMLTDLNDYTIPTQEVIGHWFDLDNLLSWMAFQMLTGNIDTSARNYYLYSPLQRERWYFISWDNDAAWQRAFSAMRGDGEGGGWQHGVSNYWGSVLFNRILKEADYRQQLEEKVQELRSTYLTETRIRSLVDTYRAATEPFLFQMPDLEFMRTSQAEYDELMAVLPEEVELNYQYYLQSLNEPMPFYLGTPAPTEDGIDFNWDVAYDFDQEDISYHFQLSQDYLFETSIVEEDGLLLPQIHVNQKLAPGQYFFRVLAENTSGYEQTAFDYYVSDAGKIFGVKCFYVDQDGTIREEVYEN